MVDKEISQIQEEDEEEEDEFETDDEEVDEAFVGKSQEEIDRIDKLVEGQPDDVAKRLKTALGKLMTHQTATEERQANITQQTQNLTEEMQEMHETLDFQREAQQRANEIEDVMTRHAALEAESQQLEMEHVGLKIQLEAISDGPDSFEMTESAVIKKDIREANEEVVDRKEEVELLKMKIAELEKEIAKDTAVTDSLNPEIEELKTALVVESALPQRIAKQANHQFSHAIKSYKLELADEEALMQRFEDDFEANSILKSKGEHRINDLELELRETEAAQSKELRKESRLRITLQQLKTLQSDLTADKIAINTQTLSMSEQVKIQQERRTRLARQRDTGLQKLKAKETRILQCLETIDLDERKVHDTKHLIKSKQREMADLDKAMDAAVKQRDRFGTQEKTSAAMMESESLTFKQVTSTANEKEKALTTVRTQLSELGFQEGMMRRAVDAASNDVLRAHTSAEAAESSLLEAVNVKDDAVKTHAQLMATQDDFGRLYQMIKNDKNKLQGQIISSQQRLREMKEKLRILSNEMEILQSSVHERDVRLNTTTRKWEIEEDKKKKIKALRDKEKQHIEDLRDQKKNISSENSLRLEQIKGQEIRHNLLDTKYNRTIQARNDLGERYTERVIELRNFYEKVNVCSGILRNGVVQLQDRDEELRFLRLDEKALLRGKTLLLKQQPVQSSMQAELISILKNILTTQNMIGKMERTLEAASDSATRQMRLIGFEEPSEVEIDHKMEEVAHQLSKKEQRAVELELVLLETKRLGQRASTQVQAGSNEATQTSSSISEVKARINDMNRKLMAIVSEVSMHQGNCIKLEQTTATNREELEQASMYLDLGEAPTEDVKREWEREAIRLEQQRMAREMTELGMDTTIDDGDDARELADGTLTFAEIRPSAYFPDMRSGGLPKPRPYGREAPFKPSNPSNHLRYYKKPVASDT